MSVPFLDIPYLALVASFLVSALLVPVVRAIGFRTGKVAKPRKDRWHSQPTPTLGGVGMFAAFAVVVLSITAWMGAWERLPWGLLAASALMFALGLLDDFKQLSPPAKLVVQFLAAALVLFFGRVIDFFPWGFANVILTFFWLVGITNAINLLDNMDGLAGGISLIAASFLAYFFWRSGSVELLVLALALVGSILGFLVFNFPPARIFMGDSGSMFLGFTLAALAVAHRPRASDVFTVIGVPTMLFLLPIIDTTLVMITRLMRGQSPTQGGTDHTSHRLIAFGLNERQTVLSLYGVAIISGMAGMVLEALDYDLSLALIPVLLITFSLLTAYLGRLKVVTTYTPNGGNLSRFMTDLAYKRRVFEIILDFFIIGLAFYLAFWTHLGFHLSDTQMDLVLSALPVALASGFIAFFVTGVYRGLWRYMGMDDLERYGRATLAAVLLAVLIMLGVQRFFSSQLEFAPVIYFLFGVFLFLGLTASRASFRMLDVIYGRQQRRSEKLRVLIYGAEDAGEITLQWILRNPSLGYEVAGFVDDDPFKEGRRLHGVDVVGGVKQIENILDQRRPQGIILSAPAQMQEEQVKALVAACRARGLWVKALRLDFETIES